MATQIRPDMRIFFLETGMHFWETLIFRESLEMKWNLNVVDLRPDDRWAHFLQLNYRDLPHDDPNLCCYIRKVQPMQKAMDGMRAWVSGIRRDQTRERAAAEILELMPDGLLKVNPLLNWTGTDVQAYRREYDLPEHPLLAKSYPSIGCAPCTKPVKAGQPARSGRWFGSGKTECGLHTDIFKDRSLVDIAPKLDLAALEEKD
jgi:phosphoadenosine phosphosulfate reductase